MNNVYQEDYLLGKRTTQIKKEIECCTTFEVGRKIRVKKS
jgi:hypothetical protein